MSATQSRSSSSFLDTRQGGTLMDRTQDLLGAGLQLAHFIIPDRSTALQIVTDAARKLGAERSREHKRVYWRYKHLKRKITRTIRQDQDLFQWLIYFEAEQYERRLEQAGQFTTEDFAIRYIKHLLQITTTMSSFYIAIGMLRLLYTYSTAECRSLYEWLTDHYPESEEYRKIKGALLGRLQNRLAGFLKTCQSERGEIRFEASDDQARYVELVQECLRVFTPWSTTERCWVSFNFDFSAVRATQFLKAQLRENDPNIIEASRSHGLIHPLCFKDLTRKLGLGLPEQRLGIPRFFLNKDNNQKPPDRPKGPVPALTEQERQAITGRLDIEAVSLRQITPRVLRVVVDHEECLRLDLANESTSQCMLPEHARFIEIWTRDRDQDLLLATHWIDYTEAHLPAAVMATIDLGDAKTLILQITPDAGSATLQLEYREKLPWRLWRNTAHDPRSIQLVPASAFALLFLILLASAVLTFRYRDEVISQKGLLESTRKELAEQKARMAAESRPLVATGQSVVTYRLAPDIPGEDTRGGEMQVAQRIRVLSQSALASIELPIGVPVHNRYRATLKTVEERTVMEQDYLKPASGGAPLVVFLVPSPLLHAAQGYSIELDAINERGRIVGRRTFTFDLVMK